MNGPRSSASARWLTAEELPATFGDLPRRPAGLWCMGDPSAMEAAPGRHVAIVGTREASPYGIRIAERLATVAVRAGLVVVSGLARGIDAAAHRAALQAGGRTIGVQGTGVDVPYPASHRTLHAALVARGTVLSEMEPGTGATPGCFPRRNRLIAALCQVTVVVEAPFKSGAINTATQALELGRTVAAVPGRVDETTAQGSNQLIRDGAQVIAEVADLLALFSIGPGRSEKGVMEHWERAVPVHRPEQSVTWGASAPLPGTDNVSDVRGYSESLLRNELGRW
ncbi:MAG: DNA-processing protein DprA [Gemmatimonadaceae bacterium]